MATTTVAPRAEGDLVTDAWVWPAMTRLAECLCTEILDAGLPPTCFCGVMPGEIVDASYVTKSEGMAWVRMVGAYPYTTFPAADLTGNTCVMPIGFELEVGTLWCAPVARDARGNPPTPPAQFASTEIQMAAMAAMHRAIVCCMPRERGTSTLGTYTPIGPAGATVGGTWQLFIAGGVV
jgi:hypothetical protein